MKNDYEVNGEVTVIFANTRKDGVKGILIDTDDLDLVKQAERWSVKWNQHKESYYCEGKINDSGRERRVQLHRYVTGTDGNRWHVEHMKEDTLDNRKLSLKVIPSN